MAVNVSGGPLEWQASLDISQFQAQIKKIEGDLGKLSQSVEKRGNDIEAFAKRASAAVGAFFSLQAAQNFVGEIIRVRSEFESLEAAFKTLLGNKQRADELMRQVVDLAATTPFNLTEVAGGAKQLLAYGFAAQTVTDNLRMLGDVASGVGAPIQDIIYLYGTLRTQGRAYTKDIMQFTGRGIPVVQKLAEQFGKTSAEVMKMVEEGKVGFPEIEKAFKGMTGSGGQFFNMMAEQSKTLGGQISNLKDNWQKLLNTIGQQNQGILNDAVNFGNLLIANYQKLVDAIEVLIIAYGTYKAVQMANIALLKAEAAAGTQLGLVQALMAAKMGIATAATTAFNAALAASPIGAAVAGLTALILVIKDMVTAYDGLKEANKVIKTVTADAEVMAGKEEAKINALVAAYNKAGTTKKEQERIYKKLVESGGDMTAGLTREELQLGKNSKTLREYVAHLKATAEARGRFNAVMAAEETKARALAGDDSVVPEDLKRKESRQSFIAAMGKAVGGDFSGFTLDNEKINKAAVARFVKQQDQYIAKLKAGIKEADFEKMYKEMVMPDGVVEAQSTATTEMSKADKKALEDKKAFWRELSELEEENFNAMLSRNDAEVKAVADKYEKLKQKAKELKLNPAELQAANTRLSNQEAKEQAGVGYQQETRELEKSINDMAAKWSAFEEWRKDYGVDAAQERFGKEIAGFDSFLAYMTDKLIKVKTDSLELQGIVPTEALNERLMLVVNQQKDAADKQKAINDALYADAYKKLSDHLDKSKNLEQEYQTDLAAIRKNAPKDQVIQQEQALKKYYDERRKQAEEAAYKESEIFKLLTLNIERHTRDQLKTHLFVLKEQLKNRKNLSAAEVEALKNAIADTEALMRNSSKSAEAFFNTGDRLHQLSDTFYDMADALGQVDEGLGDTLATMGDLTNAAGDLAKGMASIIAGGPAGIIAGIGQVFKGIGKLIKVFKQAKESARKAREEMQNWNFSVMIGEFEVTALYRERLLIQTQLNKTKLDGLKAEKAELIKQKNEVNQEYASILGQLYAEVYTAGQKTEKYGGFLGIGRKTRVVDITQSLLGKSYEELESLFMQGKLEGKAKELFEQLRKLKEEGADIDRLLEENKREAQQIFTGTTADNIADTIAQGFADGKRATQDFADDFERLMQDAIISALKYKALEEPLAKFYENFAKAAEDGLDTGEVNKLREEYYRIIRDGEEFFRAMEEATGVKFPKPEDAVAAEAKKPTGLAGAFATMSQESADLLAGQFGGQRLATLELVTIGKQSITIATDSLAVQRAIEINTGLTATRLATVERILTDNGTYLRSIDRKTGAQAGALAANGG